MPQNFVHKCGFHSLVIHTAGFHPSHFDSSTSLSIEIES